MIKLVSAKCPSCGAALKLSKDDEKVKCEFCHNTILVDDAIACYKLKISGMVSVDGITTNAELISAANELLDMNEYLKAKRKFLEFSEKCPDNYQGWIGLLICRTRNFTIKDNNIMFENDVNKYYEHFLKTADDEIKEKYVQTIEDYLHPDSSEEKNEEVKKKEKKKMDPKYKPYIVPIIMLVMGFALLSNAIYVGGTFWMLSGAILLPPVMTKIKLTKKWAIIIAVILGFIGLFAFAIESPYGFEGTWKATNEDYSIEFKDDGTYTISISGLKTISGTYEHSYDADEYTIVISSTNEEYDKQTYRYYDDSKLCLLNEDICSVDFEKVNEE